jgi:hypothetical protein
MAKARKYPGMISGSRENSYIISPFRLNESANRKISTQGLVSLKPRGQTLENEIKNLLIFLCNGLLTRPGL